MKKIRGEKKKETNPCWIPDTNLFSSASKLPFDLQGVERFLGAGRAARRPASASKFAAISGSAAALLYRGEFKFVQPEIYTEDTVGFFCAEAKANANTAFSLKEY